MIRKYCDRCLNEIEENVCEMMSLSNNGRTDYFDLCKKCHMDMWEFFLKKKAEYMAEPEADEQPCPPPPKTAGEYISELIEKGRKIGEKEKANQGTTNKR